MIESRHTFSAVETTKNFVLTPILFPTYPPATKWMVPEEYHPRMPRSSNVRVETLYVHSLSTCSSYLSREKTGVVSDLSGEDGFSGRDY